GRWGGTDVELAGTGQPVGEHELDRFTGPYQQGFLSFAPHTSARQRDMGHALLLERKASVASMGSRAQFRQMLPTSCRAQARGDQRSREEQLAAIRWVRDRAQAGARLGPRPDNAARRIENGPQ